MSARVTMRDVAEAVGVSPMTVSRALRDDETVSAKTRGRIQAAARDLGYVYDTTAQAFRSQRSGFVAVTLPSINNANFADTHRGLTHALSGTALELLLGSTDYRIEEEEHLVRQLLARRPEAVVMTGGSHTDVTRHLLQTAKIPVLEIWDAPSDPLGHIVGFSNAGAMTLLIQHLADTGRRRIGFLGAEGDSDHRGAARRKGVLAAAEQFGLGDVIELSAGKAPVSMSQGADAVRRNADLLRGLDALVCVSDPVAFGALSACQALGIDVPGQLAITGFGGFEISRVCRPSITTVDVSAHEIGLQAGRILVQLLTGDAPSDPVRCLIAPELCIGGTT